MAEQAYPFCGLIRSMSAPRTDTQTEIDRKTKRWIDRYQFGPIYPNSDRRTDRQTDGDRWRDGWRDKDRGRIITVTVPEKNKERVRVRVSEDMPIRRPFPSKGCSIYKHTYIHTYIRTYIHTYRQTYIRKSLYI